MTKHIKGYFMNISNYFQEDESALESISMEDLLAEDALSMESISATLEELSRLEHKLDKSEMSLEKVEDILISMMAGDELSLESKDSLQFAINELSLESGIVFDGELTLEAVSGWWNRIKQVFVADWHTLVDGFAILIGGWARRVKTHQTINRQLRAEWNTKKRSLMGDTHKTSLAGQTMYLSFIVDNNLVRKPVDAMRTDLGYSTYMLNTYLNDIRKYVMSAKDVIANGKYDTDLNFQKTVLSNFVKLGHPRDVFKLKIVGVEGHPLMGNLGLDETKPKKVEAAARGKDYDTLAEMSDGRHVKMYIFKLDDLMGKGYVFHDVFVTTKEVDELIDIREKYLDLVSNITNGRFLPIDKMAKDLIAMTPKISTHNELAPSNIKAIGQMNKVMKNLKNSIMRPMRMEVKRVLHLTTASRTFLSRIVATAETKQ